MCLVYFCGGWFAFYMRHQVFWPFPRRWKPALFFICQYQSIWVNHIQYASEPRRFFFKTLQFDHQVADRNHVCQLMVEVGVREKCQHAKTTPDKNLALSSPWRRGSELGSEHQRNQNRQTIVLSDVVKVYRLFTVKYLLKNIKDI